jgi:hypothetical protein
MNEPGPTDPLDIAFEEMMNAHLAGLLAHIDAENLRVLGKPVYATVLLWPSDQHELVAYAANCEPGEREQIAQAMIELLTRWGHIRP